MVLVSGYNLRMEFAEYFSVHDFLNIIALVYSAKSVLSHTLNFQVIVIQEGMWLLIHLLLHFLWWYSCMFLIMEL